MGGKPEKRGAIEQLLGYLRTTHGLLNSLVLILPVFLFYQVGVLYQLGSRDGALSINGADYFTQVLLRICGRSLPLYLCFVLAAGALFGVAFWRLKQKERLNPKVYLPMIVEATLYALVFASVIHFFQGLPGALAIGTGLSAQAGPSTPWEKIFQSFGAGFNEEILFRFLLFGGVFWAGKKLKLPKMPVFIIAFVGSSLLFSAFHYIGPYADLLRIDTFMYRFWAGILLATIYWWRGLAVAVYTHAVYDLYFFFLAGA